MRGGPPGSIIDPMKHLAWIGTAALLLGGAAAQDKKAPPWSEFGGGSSRRNAHEGKLPAALPLAWKKAMGCTMPGRAQFVAGGGLLYGGSP